MRNPVEICPSEVNSRVTTAAIADGTSNTLGAAEVKAFTSYFRNTADHGPAVPSSPDPLPDPLGTPYPFG
jgi:hypothetical protein